MILSWNLTLNRAKPVIMTAQNQTTAPEKETGRGIAKTDTPSLARRYSFKLIANIAGIPLYLVMESVLPRALGPAAYGVFSYATSMFQSLLNFLDFGTSTCLFTTLAKRRNEWGLLAFFWRIAVLIFVLTLMFSGLCMLPQVAVEIMPGVPEWVMPLAGLWAFGSWGVRTLRGINDALGQTVASEKIRTVAGVLACAALLVLHFMDILSLPVLFIHQLVYLFSMIVAFKVIVLEHWGGVRNWSRQGNDCPEERNGKIVNMLALSKEERQNYTKEFAAYSVPLFIQLVAVALALMADRWLLQMFYGSVEQGYFSISQKVGMACFLFVSAMVPLLTRELSVAHGKNDYAEMGRLLTRFAPMLYAVAVYFSAFVCMQAASVVEIFGGDKFADAVIVVQIMALYPVHQGYGQMTQAVFYASGRTRALSRVTVVSSVLGFFVSLYVLMPNAFGCLGLGAFGLAAKTVIVQIIVCNFMLVMCSRFIPLKLGGLFGHQLVCISVFLGLAWVAGQSAELLPGLFGDSPFGLSGLLGQIGGFCARGCLYTLGAGFIILALPWLGGLRRTDLKHGVSFVLARLR